MRCTFRHVKLTNDSVPELQKFAKKNGIKTSRKKAELVERVVAFLAEKKKEAEKKAAEQRDILNESMLKKLSAPLDVTNTSLGGPALVNYDINDADMSFQSAVNVSALLEASFDMDDAENAGENIIVSQTPTDSTRKSKRKLSHITAQPDSATAARAARRTTLADPGPSKKPKVQDLNSALRDINIPGSFLLMIHIVCAKSRADSLDNDSITSQASRHGCRS
jgi:hypothetical protein